MKNHFIVLAIFLIGCQNKKEITVKVSKSDSLKNSIIGKWGGLNEDRPVWKISYDSILFYSENKVYPISISGNDLIYIFENNEVRLKDISVNKDTLFFYQKISTNGEIYGIVRAYRFK